MSMGGQLVGFQEVVVLVLGVEEGTSLADVLVDCEIDDIEGFLVGETNVLHDLFIILFCCWNSVLSSVKNYF